jgi:hypothetical protein
VCYASDVVAMFFKRLLKRIRGDKTPLRAQTTTVVVDSDPSRDGSTQTSGSPTWNADEFLKLRTQALAVHAAEAIRLQYYQQLCQAPNDDAIIACAITDLQRLDHDAVLVQIAQQAQIASLRQAALARIDAVNVLMNCAITDPHAPNRVFAVERIQDRHALEMIVKKIGKKDTKVYRLAREKLRLLAASEAQALSARQRGADILAVLEQLGRHQHWRHDYHRLLHLEQQWQTLNDHITPDMNDQFMTLRQTFMIGYEAWRATETQQASPDDLKCDELHHDHEQTITALCERLQQLQEATHQSDVTQELEAIATSWQAISSDIVDQSLQKRYEELYEQIYLQNQQQLQQKEQQLTTTVNALCSEAEQLLAQTGWLQPKKVAALRLRGQAIASRNQSRWQTLLQQLDHRLTKQRTQCQQKLTSVPDLLARLTHYCETGELRKAEPLFQKLRNLIDQAHAADITDTNLTTVDHQLKQLIPKLRDLQNWRRWSNDQHRETLCQDAQHLLESNDSLDVIAAQLRTLQRDWRLLDRSGPPATPDNAQRFHDTVAQITERCQPFLVQRAAEREAYRHARLALCQQLEQFLEQVNWEQVDWKAMVKAEREIRTAWNATKSVGEQKRQPLASRFRRAMERLEQALAEERARNLALKRELITRMLALHKHDHLEQAIAEAKQLRQLWQTTVPSRRREENALWEQFRAASEEIFARRTKQRQAREQSVQKHQQQREQLCNQARILWTTEQISAPDLLAAWQDLEQHWRNAQNEFPLPRKLYQTFEQHWQTCRNGILERHRRLQCHDDWLQFEQMEAYSELCQQATKALLETESADQAYWRSAWHDLPPLADQTAYDDMLTIFNTILHAFSDPAHRLTIQASQATHHHEREKLCLQLEIATHLDSPQSLSEQRLELQVDRLQHKLGAGDAIESGVEPMVLLKQWCLAVPAQIDDVLQARFQRIKAVLQCEKDTVPVDLSQDLSINEHALKNHQGRL